MAITSTRPARYGINERVSFIHRGTTRSGRIVGRELAEHRRGFRATDGHLYVIKADVDNELLEVVERHIAERTVCEQNA